VSQLLKPKLTVETESSNLACTVESFLGSGGQGEVYRCTVEGTELALKWYYPNWATAAQRGILQQLAARGRPSDSFLWPVELVRSDTISGFGYLMPLRDPLYKSMADLMRRRIDPSFRALATAGMQLSHSYHQLHSQGFCYRDISFGNVFLDPRTGHVLICDNDNVAIDGQTSSVGGTIGFMAPEVMLGQQPSTGSDLFSLAVLLFYMFVMHHPLEGKLELAIHSFDLPAKTKLYATEPVFIFDPSTTVNRPVPDFHRNACEFWPIYPEFLRKLFTQAFTTGLKDPAARVRESQWRQAMVRLQDSILYCPACGSETFYDRDALRTSGRAQNCWSCRQPVPLPYRIRIGSHIVMLNHDTKLFPHHVNEAESYDFSRPVGVVVEHPSARGMWGLRNDSEKRWIATTSTGTISDVPPGRAVNLAKGTKIQFDALTGEIHA